MLIGISGKIGSGKDTLGKLIQYANYLHNRGDRHAMSVEKWLKDEYGRAAEYMCGWEIKKFAYKLKQIASLLTGIPIEKFEDQDFKETFLDKQWNMPMVNLRHEAIVQESVPMKVREFMQLLGTEAMRFVLHEDVWVNALFANYLPLTQSDRGGFEYPNWIITDVRFPNEAKAIKDRGGILIRVNRGRGFVSAGNWRGEGGTHTSEFMLDDYSFDAVYKNDGTIEELAEFAKRILYNIK